MVLFRVSVIGSYWNRQSKTLVLKLNILKATDSKQQLLMQFKQLVFGHSLFMFRIGVPFLSATDNTAIQLQTCDVEKILLQKSRPYHLILANNCFFS